ncbi:hypothetical protein [Chryseobacterium sp. 52]|uniref:hypothetical protein n=1 Tax=Chryseobacterium sp. 52 TaxID=2035213 RepID=UPI000C19CFF3|nr:hypothetical protein [Chryseobacterium sp. 52]
MENIYKIYENQSWLDVSNHLYGNVGYSFELAILNNASPSDMLKAGQEIIYNAENTKEVLVLKSLNDNKSIPATAKTDGNNEIPVLRGIGYMRIGGDFKVS